MHLFADLTLLEISCRTITPDHPIDWGAHGHYEFCLVLEGTPTIGIAGSKILAQGDTLFLFNEGESRGIWNAGPGTVRIWQLEFNVSAIARTHFSELFERPPGERGLRLSAGQRQRFS